MVVSTEKESRIRFFTQLHGLQLVKVKPANIGRVAFFDSPIQSTRTRSLSVMPFTNLADCLPQLRMYPLSTYAADFLYIHTPLQNELWNMQKPAFLSTPTEVEVVHTYIHKKRAYWRQYSGHIYCTN